MAKQIAIHVAYQKQPAVAPPVVRRTFGLLFYDADGRIESPAGKFATSDLFWGYEAVGATAFSVGKGLAFVGPDGLVRGLQFVASHGWNDITKVMEAAFAGASAVPQRRRLSEFLSNLFSSHEWIGWIDVVQSHHPFLSLDATGGVTVNGKPMQVGDSPVAVGNSWFISRPGDGQVQLADIDGVFDRYQNRFGTWQRLVKSRSVPWSELGPGIFGTSTGELVFTAERIPALIIPAGAPFTIHLSGGRLLVRRTNCGSIYAVQGGNYQVEEYECEGCKLWKVEPARDGWTYELLGVPGHDGDKPVLFKEITPGVVVYQNGKVEALHRAFLGGELIDLRFGGVSIRRAAGNYEPLYISANGVVAGSLYAASGDWFKMSPVSPDQKSFSWRRCLGQQDFVTTWAAHSDRVIGETAGLRSAGLFTAALWRLVKAADSEPFFAPFSFIIFGLYVIVQIARAALLMFALPISGAARILRRVRRAFQLTR